MTNTTTKATYFGLQFQRNKFITILGWKHGDSQAWQIGQQLRVPILNHKHETEIKLVFYHLMPHLQWYTSSNKARPKPLKQCHQLGTKYSNAETVRNISFKPSASRSLARDKGKGYFHKSSSVTTKDKGQFHQQGKLCPLRVKLYWCLSAEDCLHPL